MSKREDGQSRGRYVAAVIDLFSRLVVGWSMTEHMQASAVTDALRMA
jgi:putative transposase